MLLLSVDDSMFAADNGSRVNKEGLIKQDYERVGGKFRMLSGVIDGKEVPDDVRREKRCW